MARATTEPEVVFTELAPKLLVAMKQGDAKEIEQLLKGRHQITGKYEDAIKSYEEALKIDEILGDIKGKASDFNNIGSIYLTLGKYEEARAHYQEAIRVATEMRFRPELAITRFQLAELLLEHYPEEKPETIEHLNFAIDKFREMKMQPYLERALKRKETLEQQ